MTSKKETPENDTDLRVPVVQPIESYVGPPAEDSPVGQAPIDSPVGPTPSAERVESPELAIPWFANKIEQLVSHAHEQAQVQSEYQSRWQWWKNHLEAFSREVKQHVKD